MGRPIKKLFIGERAGAGVDGHGIADVTINDGGTGYTAGSLVIDAPTILGGVQAEGTFTETAGVIDGITITVEGSGYTDAPNISIDGDAGGNADADLLAVLTTGDNPVILATAYVTGGSNENADIIAQKGQTIYRVTTATGTEECNLIDPATGLAHGTPAAAGEMQIIATDSGGATYSVTKLYNGHVRLENIGGSPEFADDVKVKWAEDGVAVLDYSVKITA